MIRIKCWLKFNIGWLREKFNFREIDNRLIDRNTETFGKFYQFLLQIYVQLYV